ncbi:sensor c-di-GMP phosphodiesterase-like protein [Roseateles asaccharophilus]|uniref:EAL domain-containing protein n=1 Tax=Roseateles asaccharophilus TaxID=582607 RepID=UPI00383435F7
MLDHRRTAISVAVAATCGLLAAGVVAVGCIAVILGYEQHRLEGGHAAASDLISKMATSSMKALRAAESSVKPECSEATLIALRRLAVASDVIAEFGIRGPGDSLVCTTTEGELEQPFKPEPEDVIVIRDGMVVGLAFNKPVIYPGWVRLRSTIVSTPHFTGVIHPALMKQIRSYELTSIRMLRPGGGSIPILSNGAALAWIEDLLPDSITPDGFSGWLPEQRVLAISRRVPGTEFVAQGIYPVSQLLLANEAALWAISGLCVLVATGAFSFSLPRARRWFALGSRVQRRLSPKAVVCMLQPIVRLDTGEVVGGEMLMRLKDGDQVLQPGDVIPAVLRAKATDLFDSVVAEKASAVLQGLELPDRFKIAVNFFPETLKSGLARQLLATYFRPLKDKGAVVAVEVIEEQMNHEIADRIREIEFDGYEVSLDDFGTGFSNLSSVKNLAPSYLKIDRSFVRDMVAESARRSTLIPEIIQIARAVGAQVVAEGIETADQARLLRDLGAEFGQGFFFGRPMTVGEFQDYLADQLARRQAANVTPALLFNVSPEGRRA